MKAIFLTVLLFANTAFGACDWSKIKDNGDGTYTYSRELNLCVGQMKQDLEIANKQVLDLTKAFELKDRALQLSNTNVALWMDTSIKLNDNIQKYQDLRSRNQWLYFGLGFAAAYVTATMANKLR